MSDQNGPSSPLSHFLLFARNFLKHPAMLGSLIPSSPFLVNDLLRQVDWGRARVIVEYGPGVGTITREVLKRMRPEARMLAIELNSDFARFLADDIRDPRLQVVCGSAIDVAAELAKIGALAADCVISGIPYSCMSRAERRSVVRQTRRVLAPCGMLLVYQFTSTVLPDLKSSFGQVTEAFQPLNILPARIFHCTP